DPQRRSDSVQRWQFLATLKSVWQGCQWPRHELGNLGIGLAWATKARKSPTDSSPRKYKKALGAGGRGAPRYDQKARLLRAFTAARLGTGMLSAGAAGAIRAAGLVRAARGGCCRAARCPRVAARAVGAALVAETGARAAAGIAGARGATVAATAARG